MVSTRSGRTTSAAAALRAQQELDTAGTSGTHRLAGLTEESQPLITSSTPYGQDTTLSDTLRHSPLEYDSGNATGIASPHLRVVKEYASPQRVAALAPASAPATPASSFFAFQNTGNQEVATATKQAAGLALPEDYDERAYNSEQEEAAEPVTADQNGFSAPLLRSSSQSAPSYFIVRNWKALSINALLASVALPLLMLSICSSPPLIHLPPALSASRSAICSNLYVQQTVQAAADYVPSVGNASLSDWTSRQISSTSSHIRSAVQHAVDGPQAWLQQGATCLQRQAQKLRTSASTNASSLVQKVKDSLTSATSSGFDGFSSLRNRLHDQVRSSIRSLKSASGQAGQKLSGTSHPNFQSVLSYDPFRGLLAEGSSWDNSAADFWESAGRHASKRHAKGAALLLTCRHPAECNAAAEAVAKALMQPLAAAAAQLTSCTLSPALLQLEGAKYSTAEGAGQLQLELASFLSACPQGVVLLQHVHRLALPALQTLNSALSESGNLSLNGTSVPSSHALYIILAEQPGVAIANSDGESVPAVVDDVTYSSGAKQELIDLIAKDVGGEEDAGSVRAKLESFRRRIDHVAPARYVPLPLAQPGSGEAMHHHHGVGDLLAGARHAAEGAKHAVEGVVGGAKHVVEEAMHGAHELAHGVKQTATGLGHGIKEVLQHAPVHDEPVVPDNQIIV